MLEECNRLGFGWNKGLQISCAAYFEDERRSTEHAVLLYRLSVVSPNLCHRGRILDCSIQCVDIQPGLTCNVQDGAKIVERDTPSAAVARCQQGEMESLEQSSILPSGRLANYQRQKRAWPGDVLLLPHYVIGTLAIVHLIQRKALPGNLEPVPVLSPNSIQPHGCIVNVGSGVIPIDFHRDRVHRRRSFLHSKHKGTASDLDGKACRGLSIQSRQTVWMTTSQPVLGT